MSGFASMPQQTEKTTDYTGKKLIARVVENRDPDKLHRIKVHVPDIMEWSTELLPWCIPDSMEGGAGPEEISQNIPRIGSKVYVVFQGGDIHFPMYVSQVMDHTIDLGVLAENYPHRKGWVRKGHHLYVDHATEEVEYRHPTGMRINVATNGRVFITTPNEMEIHSAKNMLIRTDANLEIRAAGSILIRAGTTFRKIAGSTMTMIAKAIFHQKG